MTNFILKKSKKIPLRLILILPFVIQIFTAVGLVGYLSFRNGEKAVNDLASQLIKKVNRIVTQHLDTYLVTPHQINQINLDANKLEMLNLQDFRKSETYFWKQMQVFNIGYISFANPKGEFIGVERLNDGNLLINEVSQKTRLGKLYVYSSDKQGNINQLKEVKDYDPRQEAWYADAVKANKPLWSQIYQWEDKPDIFSISSSYPVYNRDNQIAGVLSVDLILSQISTFLANLKIGKAGQTFILERSGLIVASSANELPYKVINGKAERLSALNSQNSLIKATAQYIQQKYGDFRQIEGSQETNFILQGERQYIHINPWRDKFGLDWLVVVVVPESEFMAQINENTRTSIILCFIALTWATAIGIFTSRWITQPILSLQAASLAIASGKLDQKVEIKGIDELESLAQSFNQMATQLATAFIELEARVEERTAELKAAKEIADSANNAKSEFLANMSHELRTPLNGILGYAQILGMEENVTFKQQEGLDIIYQCGSHLLTLINDILDISRIEARKLELFPHDFNFTNFLKSIFEICRIKAEQKEIGFIYQEFNKLPAAIFADEKRLRQVLLNLLGNAIKFTDSGQVIFKVDVLSNAAKFDNLSNQREAEITSHSDYQQLPIIKIRFQIEDTGLGMSPEQLHKIFLPFEQVGNKQRMAEGTGLGLAISQQIVQMMGSEIHVESTLGQGSKFWFDVDLQVSQQWIDLATKKTTNNIVGYEGNHPIKVLVVDDRWENRSVIVNFLEPLGFTLMEAVNGQEGLEKALAWSPDLIITDIVMPLLNGWEMTRNLRSQREFSNPIIIASSANVCQVDRQQSYDSGCNDFLPKPVESEELLAKIQQHLGINWIYQESNHNIPESVIFSEYSPTEWVFPATDELKTLVNAATIGDITGVEQEAQRLQNLDNKYLPFTTKLLELTQNLDEEAIIKLVKQYISQL
ncbi:Cache sensor hybrid histidine kinase [Tolypothrix tenuis PCC 7101]|uniref:Circadian input-output histidine kinase CikA n=1 Tax=Tolypothrix tenuis PCC 7101 TaxID=231146 RepID=A0A1Z4MRU6_9CYAN|nr:response regulator [Aulosira sp. FACHB-113]BAY96188.1 Cache sensor hybrid histidine kinase [Tolypothrix tenuis PCC 7101]BAZ73305.1 Cache sensor hybrid histidine kinase [Aulosira laxa NIES-50]